LNEEGRRQGQLLEQLEEKYSAGITTGYPRRRAVKVRMNIQKTLDIVM
jgi:hypothetical protein